MPRGMWIGCLAVVLPLFAVDTCRAGLVVSIVNTTVAQGGTRSVEVGDRLTGMPLAFTSHRSGCKPV